MDNVIQTTNAMLLVDNLPFRRAGMAILLEPWAASEGLRILSCGHNLETVSPQAVHFVLLAGSTLGNSEGGSAFVENLHVLFPGAPIAILADSDATSAAPMVCARGVQGYIPTSLDLSVVTKALSLVLAGGLCFPPALDFEGAPDPRQAVADQGPDTLTVRQSEIRSALRQGSSNKMIARELNIAEATVKLHIRHIMRKLGVINRTQIALSVLGRAELPALFNLAGVTEPTEAGEVRGPRARPL